MTTDQVITREQQVFLRFGAADVHIPEPLAALLLDPHPPATPYLGVGSPNSSKWLFPGMQPGRPLTAARLGERLRTLGIRAQPGRRAAMTHLAAQVPAAVLADLLNLAPTTAVKWVHDAGGDWYRYAAGSPAPAITNHDEYSPPPRCHRGIRTVRRLPVTSLSRGGSLIEARELLGHARTDTTMIYARTDLDSLRALIVPWARIPGA